MSTSRENKEVLFFSTLTGDNMALKSFVAATMKLNGLFWAQCFLLFGGGQKMMEHLTNAPFDNQDYGYVDWLVDDCCMMS